MVIMVLSISAIMIVIIIITGIITGTITMIFIDNGTRKSCESPRQLGLALKAFLGPLRHLEPSRSSTFL